MPSRIWRSLDVTKSEYEKLEQELEELEQEIQKAREVTTRKTLEKQNLENRIHLLQEQIRSAVQKEEQYQERTETLQADYAKKTEEEQGYLAEKEKLEKILRECEHTQAAAQSEFKEAAMEIQKLEETVEQGKNEIIELLNLRASTKGKLQRYDDGTDFHKKSGIKPTAFTAEQRFCTVGILRGTVSGRKGGNRRNHRKTYPGGKPLRR